ncbi:MAG: AAA family ATPase [Patescibacteria group bacterium]|nr:AAA family ATPase [Patescibacteria group bacterium]
MEASVRARQAVPGDVVNRATAQLPDNQRSAIRRFHAHYIENGMSLEEAAKLIRVATPTLSLVFNGRYNAKLDNITAEIESFFNFQEKRSLSRKLDFVPTRLTEQIWQLCEQSVEFNKIGFLFGDMQIGKTAALQAYQRAHNHGSTVYVEVPTGGCLLDFLVALASKLRISPHQRICVLRQRIIGAFDDRMLLIVDEIHRTVDEQSTKFGIRTIEFLRELYNTTNCGMVLCGTNVFRDEMEAGELEKVLRQLKRRRFAAIALPNAPTREDLNTFAAAYSLPPSSGDARKLESRMVEQEALGMWLTLLRMAAKLAARRKVALEWSHVLSAYAGLVALEGTAPRQ